MTLQQGSRLQHSRILPCAFPILFLLHMEHIMIGGRVRWLSATEMSPQQAKHPLLVDGVSKPGQPRRQD
ncbi:hypothetical protein E2P81_ATG03706 [Venturia nashicola]|uniref:Uncharacterized protein n=1 Tax=Venturia nashicola TaxID=86259 RepID=A0A4Z1PPS3_9PEZI|nr:hypothetical protein E6O75_ATG03783 [Venturia nashicola]TLD38031.1 hypothetical protein E2P81_ATG03706 [Venturia nashicola]